MKESSPTSEQAALDLPRLIERMHRRYLDVVRVELARLGIDDISPAQAMMLGTIGAEEISVRDLIERGYYLGTTASYNLKNLVDHGYVLRQASTRDRRAARLRLAGKGKQLLDALGQMNQARAESVIGDAAAELEITQHILHRLERCWSAAIIAHPLEKPKKISPRF